MVPEGEPDPTTPSTGGAPAEPEPAEGGRGGVDPVDPMPEPPSEAFLRGEALVQENGCAMCHQQNYAGFSVFPNITPDTSNGIGNWSDEAIVNAIRDGVDADGASMCPTMARYPFNDEEAADIVAFLRGIPPVASKPANVCPGHG